MEREILFKGKRLDNGEWVEGDGIHYPKSHNWKGTCWIDGMQERANDWVQVDPETVCQYTGLKDKNGKKIFEGDIIQSLETKETAVVQWFPEHSAFMVWCKSSNEVGFLYECTKSNIEVIGNIHDNPELLEQEADNGKL